MNRIRPPQIGRRLGAVRDVYQEYPRQFWVLTFGSFVDRLGAALLFPFFTLYITEKFSVGMTDVGIIFALFSISSVGGSFVGGALTDRLGRKGMLLFGLVMSALSSLLMGFVDEIQWFYAVTLFVGLLANAGGPAQQAMVADLLPEEKRAQGFGILRVVVNLSFTIGPMLGGLLASRSFLFLFVADAVASLITAAIVFFSLDETRPAPAEGQPEESVRQTFTGYLVAIRDTVFVWFLAASVLMVVVYMQMNTTLAVFLRDTHGVSEQAYGYILSLNAAMVVLLQFPITRWVSQFRPLMVMGVGTLLYALGFGLYGVVSVYILFLAAMAIITLGEMFVSPVGQAIVTRLAPEDMRGRYLAVFGFSWVIPTAIGPLLAGLVMDNADPRWVWYGAAALGLISASLFFFLQRRVGRSALETVDARLQILARLEEQAITGEEAARLLQDVEEPEWAKLGVAEPAPEARHVRIQVRGASSGAMKADLRLPMGVINTVLQFGGKLSPELSTVDPDEMRDLLERSEAGAGPETLSSSGDDEIQVSIE